jgi:hypothetical protein
MTLRLTTGMIAAVFLLLTLATQVGAQTTKPDIRPERPRALVPLYITFAGLQALDVHSTIQAVNGGARESNPVVRGALDGPAQMILMKTATAAGVVVLTERLWRRNRTAAVITMIALNSAYLTIAAHNYRQK